MISKIEFNPDLSIKFKNWLLQEVDPDFISYYENENDRIYNLNQLLEFVKDQRNVSQMDYEDLEFLMIEGIEWIGFTE